MSSLVITPRPRSEPPERRKTSTPKPEPDEPYLRRVRTPPTPPVRTEITKYLVFVLARDGIHIILGIKSPKKSYELGKDVPKQLYAIEVSSQPYTRDDLRAVDYGELLKDMGRIDEETAREIEDGQEVVGNNARAKEILNRPLLAYCIETGKEAEKIKTPDGKIGSRFLDALFSRDLGTLDRLTGITQRIDLVLVVAELPKRWNKESKPDETEKRAYFILCEKKDAASENPLPGLPNDLHPIKILVPLNQDELANMHYADMEIDDPDEDRKTAEKMAPLVVCLPGRNLYTIEDFGENQEKITTPTGKMDENFVKALFAWDTNTLDEMTLFRVI